MSFSKFVRIKNAIKMFFTALFCKFSLFGINLAFSKPLFGVETWKTSGKPGGAHRCTVHTAHVKTKTSVNPMPSKETTIC